MNNQEINKKWTEIVKKAWEDEKFKKELLAHPNKVLKDHGLAEVGKKRSCKIIENTADTFYLVLPEKPSQSLSDKELHEIAAAGTALIRSDLSRLC